MTKYGLAAALIAIIGVLVFGYAREYVPTDHRLELEGELNLEPIEPLISYIADQYGVSAVDLRIIVDERTGPDASSGDMIIAAYPSGSAQRAGRPE